MCRKTIIQYMSIQKVINGFYGKTKLPVLQRSQSREEPHHFGEGGAVIKKHAPQASTISGSETWKCLKGCHFLLTCTII
jgi:hypothetical protein